VKQLLVALLMPLCLAACSVVVPVQEAEPPEALGDWGFRVSYFNGSSPQIAPSVGIDSVAKSLTTSGVRLGIGFLSRAQVNVDVYHGGLNSTGDSIAIKWQWTGDTYFNADKGNLSQTTVLRAWQGTASGVALSSSSTHIFANSDLSASGEDVTQLFGYRFFKMFGIYGGPKVMWGKVAADYRDTTDGPVVQSSSRNLWGGGGLTGVFFSPRSKHAGFDLVLESEFMNMPETYSNARTWYTSVMLSVGVPFSFAD
jgi:hypothetical protein